MTPFLDLTESQKRQYIDAEAVFCALEQAVADARGVRGSMFWREQAGRRYLIRESAAGAQKSLGPDTLENQQILVRFVERKADADARVQSLKAALKEQQRLNRALRVGRVPNVVVDTLQALSQADLQEHFLTVGTHALYAYETAAGIRVQSAATATRDIDLLFDTQKRLSFVTQLQRLDTSLMGVLRKADKTFKVRRDQLQTAVNAKGFEIELVADTGPYSSNRFSHVVVATSGAMARMDTIHPADFARIKHALAARADRDPLKKSKDELQAQVVEGLLAEYLPHLQKT